MRRLILGFAGRTYHIVGNLMTWLIWCDMAGQVSRRLIWVGKHGKGKVLVTVGKSSVAVGWIGYDFE